MLHKYRKEYVYPRYKANHSEDNYGIFDFTYEILKAKYGEKTKVAFLAGFLAFVIIIIWMIIIIKFLAPIINPLL